MSHWHGKKCEKQCGYVCSSPWMKAAKKRRPDDFKKRIIATVTTSRKDLYVEERRWLDMIKDDQLGKRFYNLQRQANNLLWTADDGKRKTANEKRSAAQRGKPKSAEHCAAMRGKTPSTETRAKLSAANQRRKERGWTPSPESRAASADGQRGKIRGPRSAETREKISRSKTGKRYHDRAPYHKSKCPHCDLEMAATMFTRYHGDRCRHRAELAA